jgi:hypothetical protein
MPGYDQRVTRNSKDSKGKKKLLKNMMENAKNGRKK